MTNKQRLSALMGKLDPKFAELWRQDRGLAGNSKDTKKFVVEKEGKSYLILERSHVGASGKFSTVSVHVLNEERGVLDYVKAADSYELAKLNPCK